MRRLLTLVLLTLCGGGLLPAIPASAAPTSEDHLSWQLSPTGVAARLRGLSAVNRHVAWASGSLGTVLRTTDGGKTWQNVSPPGVTDLQFRDIQAFDANNAVILSIGNGELSRVYRTTNGGATWTETFRNTDAAAFYDCMAFFDRRHGLAMSDPVDGKFRVLSTSDGGSSWTVLPNDGMPAALTGEAAFAASGQCISVDGDRDAWIASGGGAQSRVYHSRDRGLHWTVGATPLASSPSAGVFATAFRDQRGIAVGGDFANPTNGVDALAITRNGSRTWDKPATAPQGYRSGVALFPFFRTVAFAVGPTGSDITLDGGRNWHQFDAGSFDTVDCTRDGACWAAGEQGRVATLRLS
jgi:photosystem II stability/assembly factor-like uncharacterized protein